MILVCGGEKSQTGRITIECVMLAILEYTHEDGDRSFTTVDIAREIGCSEYPVRAAFGWLLQLGKIGRDGNRTVQRTTLTTGEKYPVTIYRAKPQSGTTPEFMEFYRRFCGGE